MKKKTPLERAIGSVGSQAELARRIGVSQQAVSVWTKKGNRVPAEMVVAIEVASGIPRHELRPDMFAAPAVGLSA